MNAGEIITAARGLDPSFSATRHPKSVCYPFLTRYQRSLSAKMVQRDRQSISAEITIDLPLGTFSDGAPLESAPGVPLQYDRLDDIAATQNTDIWPVELVPFVSRFNARSFPFVWQRQDTLYLGGFESWWSPYSNLIVTYAPTAGTIAAVTDDLILPDSALEVATLALGAEFVLRKPDEAGRKTLPGEFEQAERDYLNIIEERNGAEVGFVRRVFSG